MSIRCGVRTGSGTSSSRRAPYPVPSRSAIYRALVRGDRVDPAKRKRRRADYRRWERGRPMELWQMDIVGGMHLADGVEVKCVTGIDDNSRFVVSAKLVARATARPVCEALLEALGRHGVPEQILTDNGKVFTGRFGPRGSASEVMFDRICAENGIRHLLTAPRSPTTTGKVERLHKTMRAECFRHRRPPARHHRASCRPPSTPGWSSTTPGVRTSRWGCGHRSSGSRSSGHPNRSPPWCPPPRVGAGARSGAGHLPEGVAPGCGGDQVGREGRAGPAGRVHLPGAGGAGRGAGGVRGRGQPGPDLPPRGAGRLRLRSATRAARRASRPRAGRVVQQPAGAWSVRGPQRPGDGAEVTRMVDAGGSISFAGTPYRAGTRWAGQQVRVRVVGKSVQISHRRQVLIRSIRSVTTGPRSSARTPTPLGHPSGGRRRTRAAARSRSRTAV